MRTINTISVHQSAGSNTETVESIRRYHMEVRGYSDVGYHYVITRNGVVHPGRPLEKIPAAVKDENAHMCAICCVGAGAALPIAGGGYMTKPQWASLVDLCETLCRRFALKYWQVKGHREYPSGAAQKKSCPGFSAKILRLELKERLAQ